MKGGSSNGKVENPMYRLFRETGRHLTTIPIRAGDEAVFAGPWLVKSQHEGTLHALGDVGKIWDGFDRAIINKNMPEEWHLMPHRARQAIPVLTTLDGRLIYPQIMCIEKRPLAAPIVACFLGRAKNPVFVVDTSTSVPS